MTTSWITSGAAALAAGLAGVAVKPMAPRALPTETVPVLGPAIGDVTPCALGTVISAALAGDANAVTTRPPDAAMMAAPLTAGCADSFAMTLSSPSGLKRPGAR